MLNSSQHRLVARLNAAGELITRRIEWEIAERVLADLRETDPAYGCQHEKTLDAAAAWGVAWTNCQELGYSLRETAELSVQGARLGRQALIAPHQ